MTAFKIAGVQLNIAWESPQVNFRRAEDLITGAASGGARLVALPEMFATGFSMDSDRVSRHGEATRSFLSDLARRLGIWILGGYGEPSQDPASKPRNACSLMAPTGDEALRYHKIHPFSLAGEHRHYEGGTNLLSARVEGLRITPLICYDLRFPEPFRAAAGETDLFVVIANWPDPRIDAWSALLTARAIENQAYVLGVNRVGEGGGLPHSGCSALIDPLGRPIATVSGQEAVLQGEVDAQEVAAVRDRFSFLADRRPEVYREL